MFRDPFLKFILPLPPEIKSWSRHRLWFSVDSFFEFAVHHNYNERRLSRFRLENRAASILCYDYIDRNKPRCFCVVAGSGSGTSDCERMDKPNNDVKS